MEDNTTVKDDNVKKSYTMVVCVGGVDFQLDDKAIKIMPELKYIKPGDDGRVYIDRDAGKFRMMLEYVNDINKYYGCNSYYNDEYEFYGIEPPNIRELRESISGHMKELEKSNELIIKFEKELNDISHLKPLTDFENIAALADMHAHRIPDVGRLVKEFYNIDPNEAKLPGMMLRPTTVYNEDGSIRCQTSGVSPTIWPSYMQRLQDYINGHNNIYIRTERTLEWHKSNVQQCITRIEIDTKALNWELEHKKNSKRINTFKLI